MIEKVPGDPDLLIEELESECLKKCQDASGCAPGVNNWTRTIGIIRPAG
jgi:hypothetical protein